VPLLALLLTLAAATPPSDDRDLYARLCGQVAVAYDSARGGFVDRDGVPSEDAVELALLQSGSGSRDWKARGLATIAWTRALRDTVGGGFVVSGTESEPNHARIFKPVSTNARRLDNLIQAWNVTSDAGYQQEAARVVDFIDRVLLDGRGGFLPGQASGLDLLPDANGIAIRAWLNWAATTNDTRKRDFALKSLDRVWEGCWADNVGLLRHGTFGEVLMPPQLVDQVEMGRAYILAARLAGRRADAQHARVLGDLVIERFEDPAKGGFMTRWSANKGGKVRRAERVPGENARAALFLCELATLTGKATYRDAARCSWAALLEKLDRPGLEAADWALAIRAAIEPGLPTAPRWTESAANAEPAQPRIVRIRLPRR
jgi:uncharacterized protein YyaL (SSP411 family)